MGGGFINVPWARYLSQTPSFNTSHPRQGSFSPGTPASGATVSNVSFRHSCRHQSIPAAHVFTFVMVMVNRRDGRCRGGRRGTTVGNLSRPL